MSIKSKYREAREPAEVFRRSKSSSLGVVGGVDGGGLETEEKSNLGGVVAIGNDTRRHPRSSFLLPLTVPSPPLHHTTGAPANIYMDNLKTVPEIEAAAPVPTFAKVIILPLSQQRTLTKVLNNKRNQLVLKGDPELGEIGWESTQRAYQCVYVFILSFSDLTTL